MIHSGLAHYHVSHKPWHHVADLSLAYTPSCLGTVRTGEPLRSRMPSLTLDAGKVRVNSERKPDAMKTEELFAASFVGDYDDEQPWDAVGALRRRNSEEVFQLAAAYCRSELPIHRARALDVLAQLGAGRPPAERPHFDESE